MKFLFIESFLPSLGGNDLASSLFAGLIATFLWILVVGVVFISGVYVYLSLAYQKIGKKAGLSSPGIAWMPYGGIIAVIFEASKMHWWPFLALALGFFVSFILSLVSLASPVLVVVVSILSFGIALVFPIMLIIWHHKTYEAVGKPGWWIFVPVAGSFLALLLMIVSFFSGGSWPIILAFVFGIIGIISHFVFVGIAAWSNSSPQENIPSDQKVLSQQPLQEQTNAESSQQSFEPEEEEPSGQAEESNEEEYEEQPQYLEDEEFRGH